MERRFLWALLLTGAVIVLTPRLFPTPPASTSRPSAARDTTLDVAPTGGVAPRAEPARPAASLPTSTPSTAVPESAAAVALQESIVELTVPEARYRFSGRAPALLETSIERYRSHRKEQGVVRLRDPDGALIEFAIAIGRDTFPLTSGFAAERLFDGLRYRGTVGADVLELTFRPVPESYVTRVEASLTGPLPGELLVRLPHGFVSQETDSLDDITSLAYAAKPMRRDAQRVGFGSLDPGEADTINGPIQWAVAKTKYFVVAALVPEDSAAPGTKPFGPLIVTGGTRVSKVATRASAVLAHPLGGAATTFELYAGPQEWERLHAMGRDFENANPYGGFMQGMVQPFATIVMRVLLWMKETTKLSYGWVLVIFGVVIRILLWPLNQSAMRTSMKMQRVQPEIQAVQQKYGSDKERLQKELMRVYGDHGMTPLSPLMGCLPMLLPMPILFALFFVFQNTIEFRGVPFLWLPDISLKDPYYVIPIAMGLSMFLLSWIGMRGMPPNPQSKMMAYLLPVMMTVFFINFASGLNLYYTVQNIAALPQQWLIARERGKTTPPKGGGTAGTAVATTPAPKSPKPRRPG